MIAQEWRNLDKADWGAGPWQDEPDKRQWVDDATGLDCLMVRGPHGGWCGYVGVAEGHPWFGIGYGDCPTHCGEPWCEHSPGSGVEIHGGLTFSEFCHEPTREQWERMRAAIPEHEKTAATYPNGDSARWLTRSLPHRDDYEGWATAQQGRAICHIPGPGRPARVWWFGFDCAHCNDLSPAYDGQRGWRTEGVYRDQRYVENEVASLAAQLATVPAGDGVR